MHQTNGVENGVTHRLSALFPCLLFTDWTGSAVMLEFADLLFLPACGTIVPHSSPNTVSINNGKWTPLEAITQPVEIVI